MNGKKPLEPKWMKARSTAQARRAIADFVNENSENLSEWLQRVAYGIPKSDADGNVIRDAQGSIVYVLKPDPAAAIKAVADIAEYHLPKLQRSEQAIVARIERAGQFDPGTMSSLELQQFLAARLLDLDRHGMVIDVAPDPAQAEQVEQVPADPLPDWLKAD